MQHPVCTKGTRYILYAYRVLTIVTGDIKAPQVLLNRVPEQATEDRCMVQNLLLKINFGVEITIFTQCDEVLKQ